MGAADAAGEARRGRGGRVGRDPARPPIRARRRGDRTSRRPRGVGEGAGGRGERTRTHPPACRRSGLIPAAVLARGERAFVEVLRRRYPDALSVVRDVEVSEGAVRPGDADVAGEVAAGAAADLDATEEAGEDVAPLGRSELVPEVGEYAPGREPGDAGRQFADTRTSAVDAGLARLDAPLE